MRVSESPAECSFPHGAPVAFKQMTEIGGGVAAIFTGRMTYSRNGVQTTAAATRRYAAYWRLGRGNLPHKPSLRNLHIPGMWVRLSFGLFA